ncbi:MAG: tryptophan-rich sensory protein [Saprospiraceae bacterium]|nr:tryptophan-rich sensory protein [Saprospiraceae bacterium]
MNPSSLRTYIGFNVVSLLFALALNFLAVSLPLNNKTTGELSDLYPNYFVPAGFTFAIWGIIYSLLIAFVLYQAYKYHTKNSDTMAIMNDIGPWFFISGLANGGWIIAWHYEKVFFSLLIMILLFISLAKTYMAIHAVRRPNAADRWLIMLPFSVYLGWISVASIANVTTLLVSAGWKGGIVQEHIWAIIMIVVAVLLAVSMVFRFKDIAFTAVIAWALYGIFSKQAAISEAASSQVAMVAKYGMTLLVMYALLSLVGRKSYFFDVKDDNTVT